MAAGRHSKALEWLTDDGLLCIEGWAREGLTNEQIAKDKIGISHTTFYEWLLKYPNLADALKKGKAPVDIEVENALLKSALGYTVKVRKPIKVKEKIIVNGETRERERIETVEEDMYIAPQVTAQIFWLKNRKPTKWRDKPVEIAMAPETEDLLSKAFASLEKEMHND